MDTTLESNDFIFIGLCGKITSVLFQKVIAFITRTKTRIITIFRISNAYPEAITRNIIGYKAESPRKIKFGRTLKKPTYGEAQGKVENIRRHITRSYGRMLRFINEYAQFARKNLRQSLEIKTSIARRFVIAEDITRSLERKGDVVSAKPNSMPINTQILKLVPENAHG